MDLNKKRIQTNQEKGRASIQTTVESDYNLPDYKADMLKLIDKKGVLRTGEIRVEQDQAVIEGVLQFQVLYKCSDMGSICSLSGEIPFSEPVHMEGVEDTDQLILQGHMEDLTIGMINSRKLNVRALLELSLCDELEQQVELPAGIEDDSVQMLFDEAKVLELVTQKKDICRIRSEILLPSNKPNIRELLWQNVQLRGLDSRMREGEIELSGELFVHIIYKGEEDEQQVQCMETTATLHEKIPCSLCSPEMVFKLLLQQMQLEVTPAEDEDGECRLLTLEGTLDFYLRIWKEETEKILEDAYSLKDELKLTREQAVLQGLLVKNDSRFKVADQIPLDIQQAELLQLCAVTGEVYIEDSRVADHIIEVEGILKIHMLYITSSDELPLGAAEGVIPFRQEIEAEGIRQNAVYELSAGLDQLTAALLDNSQAEIKAVVDLDAIVFDRQERNLITEAERCPSNLEQYERQPGIAGYIVRADDRLWDIAKENHTTIQDIMRMNQLQTEAVNRGDKLLIVKQIKFS